MPMLHSPCRGCNERYLGCHSECERYNLYKKEQSTRYEMKKRKICKVRDYSINGRSYRV